MSAARPPEHLEQDVALTDWIEAHERARADGFTFFDFLTAVDETDRPRGELAAGFDLVSRLLDVRGGARRSLLTRTRLPFDLADTEPPVLPSLTGLWRGAAWHERETFEMFGISFAGFDDGTGRPLRPLLLPDGFSGQPLRKSFVLTARASKPWPGAKEPGERAERAGAPKRRTMTAPGVPDETWGPR